MDTFDNDELKSHLRDYLEYQGINTSRMFKCINPSHHDSNPSMKYFDDNRAYCFGCGVTYDLIDAISIFENLDKKDAYKKAIEYYIHNNEVVSKKKEIIENPKEIKNYEKAYEYWENALSNTDIAKQYLELRGIDENTAKRFHLGFNCFKFKNGEFNSIVIPINKNCFIARNIDLSSEFRYYKAKGSHSDLFNKEALFNDKNYCIITEGEFDALTFESLGCNALALSSVSNFSKFKKIHKDKEKVFILSLDNDNAGSDTLDKFIEYFKENHIKYKVFDNLGYKDANLAFVKEKDIFKKKIKNIVRSIEEQNEMN